MHPGDFLHSTKVVIGTVTLSAGTWLSYKFQGFLDFIPTDMPKLVALLTAMWLLMLMYDWVVRKVKRWRWRWFEQEWHMSEERKKIRREHAQLCDLRREISESVQATPPD